MGAGSGGGMGLGWIWPVVLVVGLAVLAWGLMHARGSSPSGAEPNGEPSATQRPNGAREILRERFARGEITEDELRERLRVLDDR